MVPFVFFRSHPEEPGGDHIGFFWGSFLALASLKRGEKRIRATYVFGGEELYTIGRAQFAPVSVSGDLGVCDHVDWQFCASGSRDVRNPGI